MKFVGKGISCYVYEPNFKSTKIKSSQNYVSKIINNHHVESEIQFVKLLSEIDPDNKYFIYQCDIDKLNINDIKDNIELLSSCEIIQDTFIEIHREMRGYKSHIDTRFFKQLKNLNLLSEYEEHILNKYTNIIMPNGGPALNYSENMDSSFYVKIINVFKGLCLLDVNNIVHRDIKYKNITTSPNYRIIDFGLSVKKVELINYGNDMLYYYDYLYQYWPSEFQLILKKYEKVDDDTYKGEIINNCKKYIKNFDNYSDIILENINNDFKPDHTYMFKTYQSIINTFDTYSIALLLVESKIFNIPDANDFIYKGLKCDRPDIITYTKMYLDILHKSSILTKEEYDIEILDLNSIIECSLIKSYEVMKL